MTALPSAAAKYGLPVMAAVIAVILSAAFAAGCGELLFYFIVLMIASLIFPIVIHTTKNRGDGKLITSALLCRSGRAAVISAFLFLFAIVVAGIIGFIRNHPFIDSACSAANTAARFATYMLKAL